MFRSKLIFVFLFLILSKDFFSATINPSVLEDEARLAAQIQNYTRAIQLFSKSISVDPNRLTAYAGRGTCYMELGKYDSAKTDFVKIIKLDAENYEGYYLLGNLEKACRNYGLSIDYYRKAIDVSPQWEAYLACWQAYSIWNKKDEGIKCLDSIITAKKSDPKISFNFAVLMLRQEKYKEAIGQFVTGIDMGGSSYQYHINKDYKYVDIKLHDSDFVNFVIKNRMASTKRDANYYLARIYSMLDNQEKAIEILNELHRQDPKDIIVYQDLGYAYLLDKKYKKAKAIFTTCIEELQKNDNVYCNRGIANLETGELNLALDDFTYAIGLKSNNGWAYFYRGITNARLNNMKGAYADFHTAKQMGGLLPSQEKDITTILQKDFIKNGW